MSRLERVVTFENRGSWYYVHASLRGHGNATGTIDQLEVCSPAAFRASPPIQDTLNSNSFYTEIKLDANTEVIRGNADRSGSTAKIKSIYSAARSNASRITSANFGDWDQLVKIF